MNMVKSQNEDQVDSVNGALTEAIDAEDLWDQESPGRQTLIEMACQHGNLSFISAAMEYSRNIKSKDHQCWSQKKDMYVNACDLARGSGQSSKVLDMLQKNGWPAGLIPFGDARRQLYRDGMRESRAWRKEQERGSGGHGNGRW